MGCPLGFALKDWVCPCEGQKWRWCSCLGHRVSGSTRFSGELVARAAGKHSALEGYGNKYWPLCSSMLAWRPSVPDREAWQATAYRVAKSQTLPKWPCAHRCKTCFACGSSAPVSWVWRWRNCLACGDPGSDKYAGTDCLCCRSYGLLRVFFPASCSWQSKASLASLSS